MKLSTNEIKFLESLEEARLATSHQDIPHVKPVSFVLYQDFIFVATDYDTRTWKNIKENPKAAITIDVYKSGGHKAVCFQGKVEIIEKGEEFDNIYQIFYKKFKWVRDDPWKPGEAPFLKLIPQNKTSWGIN
ncbi:MAG: pyridoxamine 5'-phosphate oxidase family protein [Candidatus Nitrosomaritimum aestuariumsis]